MCLGMPGRVVSMVDGDGDQLALVAVEGAVSRRVNICLLEDGTVGPGDWVLIHMGFALERLDEAQAAQVRQDLELMGRGVDDS
jgi:hydrogenase expression/formation protein HypC